MARGALRSHRGFTLLWAGDTVSQFGTMITNVALPLLAVSTLAASEFEMGLLTAAEGSAFLLIGLPAGVWVDRLRRRPLMIGADLGRAVLLLSVPLAWWAGVLTLAQLLVVAVLLSALTVFFDLAYQSYLPALVGREHLVEGNAKLQASQSVAMVSGPALGGGLVQLVGAANAVLANAAGYLVSGLCLWRIDAPEPRPDVTARRRMRADIAEGLRFVLGNRSLRGIVGCTATANFFANAGQAAAVYFLVRDIGLNPGSVGVLLAGAGVGGVLGALTAGRWQRVAGAARTIWLSMLLFPPFALLLPLTEPGAGVALYVLGSAGSGYGAIVYNVAQVSFRQRICPDRLLGRMNASVRFLVWGTLPLGGLAGGGLAEWLGARGTLWVSGAGGLLAVVWLLCSPLRTLRDLPTAPAAVA